MYALNAVKKTINNCSLSFLRKVCIFGKEQSKSNLYTLYIYKCKKISEFKGKSPKFDI